MTPELADIIWVALNLVINKSKVKTGETTVTADVSIGQIENGGFGLLEIGLIMVYASAFVYTVLHSLAKYPLVAKNHPMMEETLHHHI